MKLQNRLPELILLILALPLTAVLFYPLKPSPLPPIPSHQSSTVAAVQAITLSDADPQPSITETASLFTPSYSTANRQRKTTAPAEKVPWLHFIAFVVASSERTVYFFKNDQTGRVLMLTYNQPHEGWNLTRIQAGTYVLEKDNHAYIVSEK